MAKTKIEWATHVWNPLRGCSRVSEGCRHCYAERMAGRFNQPGQWGEGLAVIKSDGAHWTGKIVFDEQKLMEPLHSKKPRRFFVNSVSDLFHEKVEFEWIDRIFAVMALSPQHQFLVLTKRPQRMLDYFGALQETADKWLASLCDTEPHKKHSFTCSDVLNLRWMHWRMNQGPAFPYGPWPLPNVWLGVSCENQAAADERVPLLLKAPAAIRFVSAEPLLGPINFHSIPNNLGFAEGQRWLDVLSGYAWVADPPDYYDTCSIGAKIDWIITGGESGLHARPMLSNWADGIRRACLSTGVAFFHKQNGEWIDVGHAEFGSLPSGTIRHLRSDGTFWKEDDLPQSEDADVTTVKHVGKKRAGNTLFGRVYQQFPGE